MSNTAVEQVHEVLARHILADGFPFVFDFEKSHGPWMYDRRSGKEFLDLFSFFASQPIGFNHPGMQDADYLARLHRSASCKPTNSDVYTTDMANFVETFAETCVPESHRDHLFFIEGGGPAVENALKVAFDWKYRKNAAKGGPDTENLQVLHFQKAFHGRVGYTLSLTNTSDPRKYQYFPKFDWPRVPHPAAKFPLEGDNLAATIAAEKESIAAIEKAFDERPDLICAIIVETIQGEGGDNHVRPEYLRELRRICDEREALLVFDEVQAGMGLTGRWWAFENFGVTPDVFAFGKKAQVCGIASNHRVDDVDSVFKVSSRINSTWGGNITDMVRVERYIQVIAENDLLENARTIGAQIVKDLQEIAAETGKISNVRGQGLMIAFDLPNGGVRDAFADRLMQNGVVMLGCGDQSMRLRPALDLDSEAAAVAIERIRQSL